MKNFFSEKKKQKTFANLVPAQTFASPQDTKLKGQKFFGSFFKKERPCHPSAR